MPRPLPQTDPAVGKGGRLLIEEELPLPILEPRNTGGRIFPFWFWALGIVIGIAIAFISNVH